MLGILLMIAGLFLLLFSLMPYIPLPFFLIDTLSHFVLQYFILGMILIGVITLLGQPPKLYIPVIIALLLNIFQLYPFLPFKKTPQVDKTFKVLQANILFRNKNTVDFESLLGNEDPDIVFIDEANKHFASLLNIKQKLYPFQMQIAKDHHGFGMIVASKFPLLKLTADRCGDDNKPMISAEFDFHGKTIHFVSVHLANPLHQYAQRNEGFDDLRTHLSDITTDNVFIAGDFNITPYAPMFKKFKKDTKMQDARYGLDINNTFHTKLPVFLQIPIDHTLYKGDLKVIDYYKGTDIGSDHAPMITVFGID